MSQMILSFMLLQSFFLLTRGCSTTGDCAERLSKCKYVQMQQGLLPYDNCLSYLCEECKLCGICDGESHSKAAPIKDRKMCLKEHNKLRSLHKDTPPLEWSQQLANDAQIYANHLSDAIDFRHGAVGENMFLKIGSNGTTIDSCISATDSWYAEILNYDYAAQKPVKGKETRHFEQLVWKSNQKVGFGIAIHKLTKFVIVIGRYETAPIAGQEKENIMQKVF